MASEEQIAAAKYLAANSGFYVKRITQKAVILHCSDPGLRMRVGPRHVWRQRKLIGRNKIQWLDNAKVKLSTRELARRYALTVLRETKAAGERQ